MSPPPSASSVVYTGGDERSSPHPYLGSNFGMSGVAGGGALGATGGGFPVWALQPKRETGAKSFLAKHPDYDGRGTIIAILDSGVDPGAGGMQVTTDGKRKIIDRIDASGAGDVDMTKTVEPEDGKIKGVTGRLLTLPSDCLGHGPYRVGCKRAFLLYPRTLKDRIVKERQEKLWDPQHKLKLAEATRKLQELQQELQDSSVTPGGPAGLTGMAKLRKENLEAELELLNTFEKRFKDIGSGGGGGGGGSEDFAFGSCGGNETDEIGDGEGGGSGGVAHGDVGSVYDVVLFHDGSNWVSIIDTSECGDLEKGVRLRPFRETGDFAPLGKDDRLNISVNVYDEGRTLQIVGLCSPHGTHVASIAAAHFPDEPDKNGIAPGAQIVTITIGDARLHSMETGTAIVRAMVHIMQAEHYKVDVINMSYGEHSHWSNTGRIGELMGEVINKHGVIWVASAGNDGPALCTVGTPPDISTNTVIGVGAYVSPEMMVAMYSTREKLPGTPYTWTSRGPTIDGDRGVSVCAPGGAITSVPHFTLRGTQLMNGTSMASPHVCGAVSLLVSGLKQLNLPYSPFGVKRALENSAMYLPNSCYFGQGHGLLQIEGAFAHLCRFHGSLDNKVRYAVTCFNSSKGIHLRRGGGGGGGGGVASANKKQEVPVKVEPFFLDNDCNSLSEAKINFNVRLALVSSSSFVECPDHLDLMFVARHFTVSVDPTGLPPGVHPASIKAFDMAQPDRGHLFEIMVTVVNPEPLTSEIPRPRLQHNNVVFQSSGSSGSTGTSGSSIRRHFVDVPEHASWAVIRLQSHEKSNSGKFVVHTVQLVPKMVVHAFEHHKMLTLSEQGEFLYSIPVKANHILEVCISKWWAHIGNIEVSYSVTFHGLSPDSKELCIHGSEGIARLDVFCGTQHEEVQPEIKLKNLVQNFRPFDTKIIALGARDVIPPNRQIYELQVSYTFNVPKATEITPNFPWLSNVLYESEFESQLWMLYNSHKQLVACGDAYPQRWAVKVEKEDYTLRAHVRSESREVLDKLADLPLQLSTKLASGVNMDVYTSFAQASTGGKKCGSSFPMSKGSLVPIYISASVCGDKFVKNSTQGQFLTGTMTLAKDELGKKVDNVKVKYILPEAPKKDKTGGLQAKSSKSSKPESTYHDSVVDLKISWLSKLDPKSDESARIFEELKADPNANQIQVLMAKVASIDVEKDTDDIKADAELREVALDLCNGVLSKIDLPDLLSHAATKHDSRADAQDIKKEMEKMKSWFVDATCKKGAALCQLGRVEEATEAMMELMRLVEPTDPKVVSFSSMHAERVQHYGRAIKYAMSQLDTKPGVRDVEERILKLMGKLEWDHLRDIGRRSLELRYPESYEPF